MNRVLLFAALSTIFTVHSLSFAQQPEVPAPEKEHQWLEQFVGHWDIHSEGSAGPDQPPMQSNGTMTARLLGPFWVINELTWDMMGTPMNGIQTIGYDPAIKKYVGTWVDSMMNHMWQYTGFVDESGKILTLEAEGPNSMAGGNMTKFRDIYEFTSADHIKATSSMLGEDGKWIVFMTGEMQRTKNN